MREVAGHNEFVSLAFNPRRLEGERWVLLHVEEVGRAEMGVALGLSSLQGGSINPDVDSRARELGLVEPHPPRHLAKLATDGRHHEMLYAEMCRGVG